MSCSDDAAEARDRPRRCSGGLTGCALLASEAAAHVARMCRSNQRLLSMLVQEKCGDDANSRRFAHDFKTLADVLVQRIVAKRIGRQVCKRYCVYKLQYIIIYRSRLAAAVVLQAAATVAPRQVHNMIKYNNNITVI